MKSQAKITPTRLRRPIAELGLRIARARIARQMTQELMAQRCGVSRATIAKLENGDASVSADTLFRVLMVLGKDEDIGKLLAEDRVGYELAVSRLPRRTGSAQSKLNEQPGLPIVDRGDLKQLAVGRGKASGLDAGGSLVKMTVRPMTGVKRLVTPPTTDPLTVTVKTPVVNVTRSRPAAKVKR